MLFALEIPIIGYAEQVKFIEKFNKLEKKFEEFLTVIFKKLELVNHLKSSVIKQELQRKVA